MLNDPVRGHLSESKIRRNRSEEKLRHHAERHRLPRDENSYQLDLIECDCLQN
jgi:hypothetical protein